MISAALENFAHELGSDQSLGPVPRVSLEIFKRLGPVKPRVPMIVCGAMASWPASSTWTPDYLKSKIGARMVQVLVNTSGASNRSEITFVPFRDFVEAISAAPPAQHWHLAVGSIYARSVPRLLPPKVMRLFRRFPETAFPELAKDVPIARLVDPETIFETNLWIAYSGAVTRLHFDHMDNLLGVVSGRKRLILFDADQTKWLYPEGVLDSNFNFSKVDPEHIDNARFGDVRRAKYWECILAAGEMLYLPANYWHHVRSEGFCVSINTWFARASQYFTSAAFRRAATMVAANLGLVANRRSAAAQVDAPCVDPRRSAYYRLAGALPVPMPCHSSGEAY